MLPARPPKTRRTVEASPEQGWHSFFAQAAAFEHADRLGGAPVWALEHDRSGRRSYIVASFDDFWRRYRTLQAPFRHHYELIRDQRPCHLYFDLEYQRETNPQADGEAMVQTLLTEVALALKALPGSPEVANVIDLDSSTDKKFSHHLIVRLRECAFADNLHAGRFVHAMCVDLLRRSNDEPHAAALFVSPAAPPQQSDTRTSDTNASHGLDAAAPETAAPSPPPPPSAQRVSFVDLSVYSRNRCFRLYKSSKAGKTAQLLPAGMSEEALFFLPHDAEHTLFLDSLASRVPTGAHHLLTFNSSDAATGAEVITPGTAAAVLTPGVSVALPAAPPAALPPNAPWARDVVLPRPPPTRDGAAVGGSCVALIRGESPYPGLEAFVLRGWALKTGLPAQSRAWSYDSTRGLLMLVLAPQNRWCAHVQRPHRSNGTKLRVDLARCCFAQFCFDPECRASGFRGSDELPIPPGLCRLGCSPEGRAADDSAPRSRTTAATAEAPCTAESGPSRAAITSGGVCVSESSRCSGGGGDAGAGGTGSSSWLSEAELAALPLDDIVADYRARQAASGATGADCGTCTVSTSRCSRTDDASESSCGALSRDWWISDEALLAALPLDAHAPAGGESAPDG